MTKPIFLIGSPILGHDQLIKLKTGVDEIRDYLNSEYYVISYLDNRLTELDFKVLNAINATDIEIDELINKTKDQLDSILLYIQTNKKID
jgi:hypothetical protein